MVTEKETPLVLVKYWKQMAHGVYDELEHIREDFNSQMKWPEYCDLPISVATMYLMSRAHFSERDAAVLSAELTACWTWRKNKVIYSFQPVLSQVLAEQVENMDEAELLPTELLLRLPYPFIYIKAHNDLWPEFDGFWA